MRSERRASAQAVSIQNIFVIQHFALAMLCTLLTLLCIPQIVQAEGSFKAAGEISAFISENLKTGYERNSFSLIVGEKTVHQLFFNGAPPVKIKTGDFAYVEGELVSDPIWGNGVLVETIYALPVAQNLLTAASSSRKALVMVVNFNDKSAGCSDSAASDLMWTGTRNINGLFKESSFNTIDFPQDSNGDNQVDVVNLTLTSNMGSSCDYINWALDADTAASNAGFDLSIYDHRVYILPTSAKCDWSGLANLGCSSYCRSWTLHCNYPDVLAHELGHNLGMSHASTDQDNNGTTDCEYCDVSGVMGYGGVGYRHFNAPHKAYVGWIPSERIQTATSSGAYSVAQNEVLPSESTPSPGTDYQIVKVKTPGRSKTHYYLSYRVAAGEYSGDLSSSVTNKLNIHTVSTASDSDGYTYYVTAIGNGESWSDNNGVSISSVAPGETSVQFNLEISDDGDGDGDSDDGDSSTCTVSGTVLKNGRTPRNWKKLRVILKNTDTKRKKKSRLDSDGAYSINDCTPGSHKIKIRRKKTRKKRARTIANLSEIFEVNGSKTVDISM